MKKPERRTGERARAVLPIGVRVGRRKLSPGCTLDASANGALILCTENVEVGTELHVTNLQSNTWFTCRVVRRAGKDESGRHALGIEILGQGEEPPRPTTARPTSRPGASRRSS
jgi:hypothetical protein